MKLSQLNQREHLVVADPRGRDRQARVFGSRPARSSQDCTLVDVPGLQQHPGLLGPELQRRAGVAVPRELRTRQPDVVDRLGRATEVPQRRGLDVPVLRRVRTVAELGPRCADEGDLVEHRCKPEPPLGDIGGREPGLDPLAAGGPAGQRNRAGGGLLVADDVFGVVRQARDHGVDPAGRQPLGRVVQHREGPAQEASELAPARTA